MKRIEWTRPAAALLYYFFLLALSSVPPSDLPSGLPAHADKLIHFCLYSILGALLARCGWRWWAAGAAGMALGGFDEVCQGLLSGRCAEWGDWLADAAGVLAGVAVCMRLRRLRVSEFLR